MSSCRMSGKGPGYGAVDTNGKLFECSNVYVADASVLPTASGANPMISTMTVARHIGLGLAKDLKTKSKIVVPNKTKQKKIKSFAEAGLFTLYIYVYITYINYKECCYFEIEK